MNNNMKKILEVCKKDKEYYQKSIDLIAASNFMTKECADLSFYKFQRDMEGLLGKRPYAGTAYCDEIEKIGVDLAKTIFNAEAVNIQPHSATQANQIAYFAFLNHGDSVLSMGFDAGGHLTHGHPINFSGRFYKFHHYGINPDSQTINYNEVYDKAKECRPKLIIAGASSYPRVIDHKKMAEIASEVDAIFMVDISHPVGLIATGEHPNPVPYADVVTTTFAKTLRGPHAGMIMCKKIHQRKINQATHPGIQSSIPISRLIQIALCLSHTQTPEFHQFTKQIKTNAKVLQSKFSEIHDCVLFGGTDCHFIVINTLTTFGLSGKDAEQALEKIGIWTNRQVIPWESKSVYQASGLRIGSPSATARGFNEDDFEIIADIIIRRLQNPSDTKLEKELKDKVAILTASNSDCSPL